MRERYCQEYVKHLNQTKAADRAGFKHPGVTGAQLMAIPELQARIAELQAAVADRRTKRKARNRGLWPSF